MLSAALLTVVLSAPLEAPQQPVGRAVPNDSKSAESLTVLFFTASWCEPCRAVSPILEKFAGKNPKRAKLVAVDFDRAKGEVARWGVREIPVVIVLSPEGSVLLRCDGGDKQALAALESGLRNLLKHSKERK